MNATPLPGSELDEKQPAMAAAPQVGEVIGGRYRVDAALGAEHFKASMIPFERPVALRVLAGHDAGDRFAREAAVAGKLTHPNSVRLIDYGRTDGGAPFVAMEFLAGRTLREVLADGPLAQVRAIHIAQQICRSLREAHSLAIVHRGLRPSAVMLLRQQDEQDFAKVMDYGVTSAVPGGQLAHLPPAAAHYLAPEQARNQPADPRSDVYALGVLLYEMLTGRVPFTGNTATEVIVRHLAEQPVAPRALRPDLDLDEGLERIALRCLAKDSQSRYSSMDELLGQLKVVRARLTQTRVDLSTMPPMLASELAALGYSTEPTVKRVSRADSMELPTPVNGASLQQRIAPPSSGPRFESIAGSGRKPWKVILGACAAIAAVALVAAALREPVPPLSAAAARATQAAPAHTATPLSFGK